jgi:FixJ family two-component response regulator
LDTENPTVYVIDDDESVRKLLTKLITSIDLKVKAYDSAREFLDSAHPSQPSCLILDVRMPGLSGLDLQERLAAAGISLPIIFISGVASVPASVQAMKAGAVDFFEKPFDNQKLLDSVQRALDKSRADLTSRTETDEIRARAETLTPREREVFALVVTGAPNKLIAAELGASEQTIKIHRARVMHKMNAQSFADLIRMSEKLALPAPRR